MATSKIVQTALEKRVFYAAKNAYSSFALALAAMETAYDNLTDLEKRNAYIVFNDHVIIPCVETTNKVFMYSWFSSDNLYKSYVLGLSEHVFFTFTMNPNISKQDLSNSSQSSSLSLIIKHMSFETV